jgi:hypothetical protein
MARIVEGKRTTQSESEDKDRRKICCPLEVVDGCVNLKRYCIVYLFAFVIITSVAFTVTGLHRLFQFELVFACNHRFGKTLSDSDGDVHMTSPNRISVILPFS